MNDRRDPRAYAIIGAAMEGHRVFGSGFLEKVHQDALALEFASQGITFQREVAIPVRYKEVLLDAQYRADFICHGEVLVECKALSKLPGVEDAQVINYLKATGFHVGILLNFGTPSLQYKRLVH